MRPARPVVGEVEGGRREREEVLEDGQGRVVYGARVDVGDGKGGGAIHEGDCCECRRIGMGQRGPVDAGPRTGPGRLAMLEASMAVQEVPSVEQAIALRALDRRVGIWRRGGPWWSTLATGTEQRKSTWRMDEHTVELVTGQMLGSTKTLAALGMVAVVPSWRRSSGHGFESASRLRGLCAVRCVLCAVRDTR